MTPDQGVEPQFQSDPRRTCREHRDCEIRDRPDGYRLHIYVGSGGPWPWVVRWGIPGEVTDA